MGQANVLSDGLEQLNCRLLDAFVEHLAMLVKNEVVSGAVQFFVTERAGLLVVDLIDRILDSLPMLLSLGALHIGIAHLVAIDQKLVGW